MRAKAISNITSFLKGLSLLTLLAMAFNTVNAQNNSSNVSGGVSATGRFYHVNGIEGRMKPFTGLTNANLQFNLFGFQSGLNLTYTTDESRLQQSVNRLSFNTGWSWGRISAGDVSPAIGKFALQGSTIRGAFVEANKGKVFMSFTGGQSRKAVNFDQEVAFRPAAFQRMLYAGSIGYGDRRSQFLALGGMFSRDRLNSLLNPGDANPAENLVLTTETGIKLFENRLSISGQISASALNRDIRNPRVAENSPFPGFYNPVFKARQGGSLNLAGEGEIQFQSGGFAITTSYSRIDPGYESMGLQFFSNDQENISVQPSIQLFGQKLMLAFNFQHARNNLNNQLQSTTSRNQLGLNLNGRIGEKLNITGGYMQMNILNSPASDFPQPELLQMDLLMQTLMLTPTFLIATGSISHSVSLTGAMQLSNDRSMAVLQGIRPARDQNMYMGMLTYTLQFQSGFSLNNTANYVVSEAPGVTISSLGLNTGTGFSLLEKKLNINLNMGWAGNATTFMIMDQSMTRGTQQLQGMAGANYRFGKKTNLRWQTRMMKNILKQGVGPTFTEVQSDITLTHRF